MKQPWFQFWVGDWRQCPELRACSLAARGLWVDLLCRAHQTDPYGHVLYETLEEIALDIGRPLPEVTAAFEELERRKVFTRQGPGDISSRRMVRDEQRREQNRRNGARGGNPLLGHEDGGRITDRITASGHGSDNPQSQSQSQSHSQSPEEKKKRRRSAPPFDPPAVLSEFPHLDTSSTQAALEQYLIARKIKHGPWTAQGMRIALGKFDDLGPRDLVDALKAATEAPWQTVWPVDPKKKNGHHQTSFESPAHAAVRKALESRHATA